MLSESQNDALNLIKDGVNIFLTGSAGNGKSFLIKSLSELLPNKKIVLTATTGVAAFNIKGSTIHSLLSMGIGNYEVSRSFELIGYDNRLFIKNIDILVIDEISMMNEDIFIKVNLILQKIMNSAEFMGGKQVIVTGDFFQLPAITGKSLFENITFKKFIPVVLNTNFRQNDPVFYDLLQRIRIGNILEEDVSILKKRITLENSNKFCIFPTNAQVRIFNEKMYNSIQSKEHVFTVSFSGDYNLLKDLKKQFNDKDLTQIKLKIGCRVMLIRNISVSSGLINGSMGTVTDIINKYSVFVKFDHMESPISINTQEWENELFNKKCRARQIPLVVAYSSTIHKTQGLTLDEAYMDLRKCFCYHQVYVALSRIKSIDGLYLKTFDPDKIKVDDKVIEYYSQI